MVFVKEGDMLEVELEGFFDSLGAVGVQFWEFDPDIFDRGRECMIDHYGGTVIYTDTRTRSDMACDGKIGDRVMVFVA